MVVSTSTLFPTVFLVIEACVAPARVVTNVLFSSRDYAQEIEHCFLDGVNFSLQKPAPKDCCQFVSE
jgi:hypothetical protein